MDERRDKQPQAEPGAQPLALPAASKLSPVQQAWGAYVDHALHCPICRSTDQGSCDTAEQLYRAYTKTGDSAFRQLGETG